MAVHVSQFKSGHQGSKQTSIGAPKEKPSGAPKVFESFLAQFRIASRVLNGAMAEPVLNSPRVVAGIREGIAASVPERMDVNFEREAGRLPDAFDHPVDGIGGEWRAPLRLE